MRTLWEKSSANLRRAIASFKSRVCTTGLYSQMWTNDEFVKCELTDTAQCNKTLFMQGTHTSSTERKRWLIGALLCVALSLPAFFVGEHLHQSLNEEIGCDLCLYGVQAGAAGDPTPNIPLLAAPAELEERDIILVEKFRLFKYQRGPPLLC
ncbi:MAG: hypothetical protein ACI8Z1_000280 [Candidatus Azotimanducaceae bacterium]|jgi:hypothetical protein